MKSLLQEKLPRVTNQEINTWRQGSDRQKSDLVTNIISRYEKPSLNNIRNAINKNFNYFGIDPKNNDFMKFLDQLEFNPTRNQNNNFEILVDYVDQHKVDINHEYLTNESLYNRTPKEFEYTLNAFETVMDPSELSKYFKDTTSINVEQFYDAEGNIKPAGKQGDTTKDTIYGTIESWSHNNELDDNSENSNLYTLNDALKRFKVPSARTEEVINGWVKVYFKSVNRKYKQKQDKVSFYTDQISSIFSNGKAKPLSTTMKNKIRTNYSFATIKDIPQRYAREGMIVFLNEYEHSSVDPDQKDWVYDYVIYHDGKWILYDDYLDKNSDNSNQNLKREFLNTKIIENVSDKASITDGILKLVDTLDFDQEFNIYDYL